MPNMGIFYKGILIHSCRNMPYETDISINSIDTNCPFCGDKLEMPKPEVRERNGMPEFYTLLNQMADIHDKKSHDYASNDNPAGNYHFAGMLSQLFKNHKDAGFIGRIGEKLYRLANLENSDKVAMNENIEDTEVDLCVIMVLWMADRRNRRSLS